MGALSRANAITLVKATVNKLQKLDLFANSLSPNYDGLDDTFLAANVGDLQALCGADAATQRARLSVMLSPAAVREQLRGPMAEWAVAIGAPEGPTIDLATALFRIAEYENANGHSIDARGFTYGSASAGGSNVGNGTIRRVTVDEYGVNLEGGHAETKTYRCDQDQQQRPKHRERFTIEGATAEPDFLKVVGSSLVASIDALTSADSSQWLNNPTFSTFNGTQPTAGVESTPTATTSVTGWVLGSTSLARVSLDVVYRDLVTDSQKYSVRFTGNNSLTQTFNLQKRPTFARRRPYYVQVAIYKEAGTTGNLTITCGSQSQVFALSGLSTGWNAVKLDLDKDLYHRNWTTNDATFAIALSSYGGSGSIYIDDVIFSEMQFVDGVWVALIGGSTPFKRGDYFTIADSVAGRGVLSYWINHRSGLCLVEPGYGLPVNTGGTEDIADPS